MHSNFIEITPRHGCSTVNFLNIYRRTPFLTHTSEWLLLIVETRKLSWVKIKLSLIVKWRELVFYRRSHQRCSIKKALLKNIAIFTGKHLCWSLFLIKLEDLRACNFIKERLHHRCFPVDIVKFLRTSILKNIHKQLLLILLKFRSF